MFILPQAKTPSSRADHPSKVYFTKKTAAAVWRAEGSKKRCVHSYGGGAEGSVGSAFLLPATLPHPHTQFRVNETLKPRVF